MHAITSPVDPCAARSASLQRLELAACRITCVCHVLLEGASFVRVGLRCGRMAYVFSILRYGSGRVYEGDWSFSPRLLPFAVFRFLEVVEVCHGLKDGSDADMRLMHSAQYIYICCTESCSMQ